ncbi:hypothetical protein FBUS_03037 [Fasciolopsis buskii]|uniref:Uncharacterized protein n=1 Tax=Fasciolopsis buskii TaxID=27845 RepID=A0A8E0VI64_9TREM|nr:hypothetical protein FBUS_03037 [Fasciolopsis buski]
MAKIPPGLRSLLPSAQSTRAIWDNPDWDPVNISDCAEWMLSTKGSLLFRNSKINFSCFIHFLLSER